MDVAAYIAIAAALAVGIAAGRFLFRSGEPIRYLSWMPNLVTAVVWVGLFLLLGQAVGMPITSEILSAYCSAVGTVFLALAERRIDGD